MTQAHGAARSRWSVVAAAMVVAVAAGGAAPAGQAPSALREGRAAIPGAEVFYYDSGGPGPAIVLLHAGTGSARVWEHQWGPLAAAGYRVVAYDRRGYGRTTVDPGGPIATAADDLMALAEALGLGRFHLVGTAAGGIVAIDAALAFPARLRSLVVANSLGGVTDPSYVELGRRLRPREFAALPPDLRELGPAYRAADADGTARWLALEQRSRAPGEAPPAQPPKQRVTFAMLERLAVPTLLLTGGADMYTPPAALRLFADRIPGAAAIVLPDVGHSAYWEQPEAFNRAVLEFVRRY
ncbi:MAG: alpha/beta fold hydrolase [Vicinamibacterales bacterium]